MDPNARVAAASLLEYDFGKETSAPPMFVKITSKRQVTFPAHVLEALGVKPGDRLSLEPGPDGFVLRARCVDQSLLAPLRGKLKRGKGTFDLEALRGKRLARSLRD